MEWTLKNTVHWHCGKVNKMQKGDAVLHGDSNDVCFGKTADVRQGAI